VVVVPDDHEEGLVADDGLALHDGTHTSLCKDHAPP